MYGKYWKSIRAYIKDRKCSQKVADKDKDFHSFQRLFIQKDASYNKSSSKIHPKEKYA